MLSITLLDQTFTVHRLGPDAEVPLPALQCSFFAMTRTPEELSLVLPASVVIESERAEAGWSCFKVEGPLAFSLVGILAGIAGTLAKAGVSIFALSTFDTDYILVKQDLVPAAREALVTAGYHVQVG